MSNFQVLLPITLSIAITTQLFITRTIEKKIINIYYEIYNYGLMLIFGRILSPCQKTCYFK